MTKTLGIGRGGARRGSGRKPFVRFKLDKTNALLIAKWESLGYESLDDFINFCLAVVGKELK